MAKWRTKAYEMFGFQPGSFSYAGGKSALLKELYYHAKDAIANEDEQELAKVREYVLWANRQNDDGIQNVVDLAFFLPAFEDEEVAIVLKRMFPTEILDEKQKLLFAWRNP